MTEHHKGIMVGSEDFAELRENGCVYVDKTACLKQMFSGPSPFKIGLFLRPRRFGKTLTLSMIRNFLEINYQDPGNRSRQERLFQDLAISAEHQFCQTFMGQYPVVFVSFKEIRGSSPEMFLKKFLSLFAATAKSFSFLTDGHCGHVDPADTAFLRSIRDLNGSYQDYANPGILAHVSGEIQDFLCQLTVLLHRIFGRQAVVLIDEYDVPLQKAKLAGEDCYALTLELVKGILGGVLKTNSSLYRGIVSGCLRIAHQSIFTELNNFTTFSLTKEEYASFIGFTPEETQKLLRNYDLEERYSEISEWYDGYSVAGQRLLCPWSVLNFCRDAVNSSDPHTFQPQSYWINTSGNDIIELCLKHPNPEDARKLQLLADGGSVKVALQEFKTYPEINDKTDFDTFATLMLHTGYLTEAPKPKEENLLLNERLLKIPNLEVRDCFRIKADEVFSSQNSLWMEQADDLLNALLSGKETEISAILGDMLMGFISFRDTSYESFYHGFVLGILGTALKDRNREFIDISSNTESGDGYSDILITDRQHHLGVVIEFKKAEDKSMSAMNSACLQGLEQIITKQYEIKLKQEGCQEVISYGIAFSGKYCAVVKGKKEQ